MALVQLAKFEGSSALRHGHVSTKTARSKSTKRVRLKTIKKKGVIYEDNWLVDSPRRIMSEKTTLGFDIPSPLLLSLESFYDEVAVTSVSNRQAAEQKARSLMSTLLTKCTKLGREKGLRFSRAMYAGSTMDGTQVVNAIDVDIFMVFELPVKTVKIATLEPGYRMIPLRKFLATDVKKYDPWQFGRSTDGLYLSPLIVTRNVYNIVSRALKFNREAYLEPYTLEKGKAPIFVRLDGYVFHITPAVFLHSENVFLLTRPYRFDEHENSDMMWRVSYVVKERKLLNSMDKTDRGMRKKAFIALKALVAVEHTLNCIDSYQIKTVLFHCFDRDVDSTPRWQRNTIENVFLDLIGELYHFLRIKNLPHFYVKGYNLLDNMDSKLLHNVTQRLGFIINNPQELIRILNKRPEEPEEEVLPFEQYSRDSTEVGLRTCNDMDRFPGTEFTLLGSDSSSSSSCSHEPVVPTKGKEVTFAEATTTIF